MRCGAVVCVFALLLAPLTARGEPLTIGVSAPLSGPDAVFGDQVKLGVAQAVADTNAAGGFLGERARVAAADDGGDPKKGVEVAQAFVRSGVSFVIGPVGSAVAVPASTIYAQAGTLDISPSAITPLVTERGLPTVFRDCAREDAQGPVAARYLARHFARIAILHDRTASAKALADNVRKDLAGEGVRDVYYGSFEKGARDAAALVARLKASGAQVAVWGGGPAEAGLLVRQIKEAGLRIPVLGGLGIASEDFAAAAGASADGTLVVFPKDPRTRPAGAALLRRFQAKGIAPDGGVFYAYAAVQIIAQAAVAAGSIDPRVLAETMHKGTTFKTVLGDIAFDAKGDLAVPDLTVYVWHRGASGRLAFDDEAAS